MGQRLASYPSRPRDTQTVTLDGVQYRIRLTWRERCNAWYADLYELDGTPIAYSRRLSPGWALLTSVLPAGGAAPPGFLLVRGSEPYERDMLGDSVALVYYAESEIADPPASVLRVVV